jgi:hypothetical protein
MNPPHVQTESKEKREEKEVEHQVSHNFNYFLFVRQQDRVHK